MGWEDLNSKSLCWKYKDVSTNWITKLLVIWDIFLVQVCHFNFENDNFVQKSHLLWLCIPFFFLKKKGLACVVTDPTHLNPNSTWHGAPLGTLGLFTSQHNIFSLKCMTQTSTPCKYHVMLVWDSYQCTTLPKGITIVYPCFACIGHTKYQYENSIYNLKDQDKAFFFRSFN